MKLKVVFPLVAAVMLSMPGYPALADSTNATADKTSRSETTAKSKHSFWLSLPVRAVGVATGLVVGVPVNWVRKPIEEEKFDINDMTGKYHQPRTMIPAGILAAPAALVSGVLEGPFFALHNSLVNFAKPFSLQQISAKGSEATTDQAVERDIQGTSER